MSTIQAKDYYKGDVAREYDMRRKQNSAKWKKEIATVEKLIGLCKAGDTILDMPVGTGRFIELSCMQGLQVFAMDISDDMVREAQGKMNKGVKADYLLGEAESIPACDSAFDHVLCVRFVNWLSSEKLSLVLREITRVARKSIFLSIRIEEQMTVSENIKYLVVSILSKVKRVSHYIKNRIKTLINSETRVEVKTSRNTNEERGYTIHKRSRLMDLLHECNLSIFDKYTINIRYRLKEKTKQPYLFLHLVKKGLHEE